jgi:hypothetical protein
MPSGTMLFLTRKLPYPLANVSNVIQVRTRQDYYQIEWPQRSRRYEYGVYSTRCFSISFRRPCP